MEFGAIKDGQIQVSSEWDLNHAAIQGRLNFQKSGIKQGAWSARKNDINQWLQIDLQGSHTRVTAVASQGRNQVNQWVTKYKLQYSNDGVTFRYYGEQGQTVDKVRCDDKQFVKTCSEGNTRLLVSFFLIEILTMSTKQVNKPDSGNKLSLPFVSISEVRLSV